MTDISVVLPSYNEREIIVDALEQISSAVGPRLREIIVVDDNSPDGTWQLVKSINHPKVKLLHRTNERGLASALADGVAAAEGNIVVWMDCDLGIPPEDIPRLVEKLDLYDIAIGSRYVTGGVDTRNKFRASLSVLLNIYARFLFGFSIKDYTSGFVALRKDVLNKVSWSRKGFGEYFTEFAYKANKAGFKIIEVGYVYKDRTTGISKSGGDMYTLFRYGVKYALRMIQLKFER